MHKTPQLPSEVELFAAVRTSSPEHVVTA